MSQIIWFTCHSFNLRYLLDEVNNDSDKYRVDEIMFLAGVGCILYDFLCNFQNMNLLDLLINSLDMKRDQIIECIGVEELIRFCPVIIFMR